MELARPASLTLLGAALCVVLVLSAEAADTGPKNKTRVSQIPPEASGAGAGARSAFPSRTSPPGLKWPEKCWWAKEVAPDLHVAGRPTERQLKYAAECGFKTVVSLYVYDESDGRTFGGEPLPSSEEAQNIVEEVAGGKFLTLLEPGADWVAWASASVTQNLTQLLRDADGPVLVHCHNGFAAAFVTLTYLANRTRLDPGFRPRVSSHDVYNISAAMGLDFLDPMLQEIVASLTGQPVPENPPRPETIPKNWEEYWVAHPVYKNWFTAGQITKSHLVVMEKVGFRSVINLRSGIILDGKPNQEEVTLLNIKSNTGSYAGPGKEPRQWKSRLEETRIDTRRPRYFVSPDAAVNYESANPEEFGDRVGYQETLERMAFIDSSLNYFHKPVDSEGPFSAFFERELPTIVEIGKDEKPVLVKCSTGKRAAYVAVLAAAVQYDKDLDWALRRTRELGYEVSEQRTPELYEAYVHWLITKRMRDEL